MDNEHLIEKRLGYRTPRSILLPPYLAKNPYYVEFTDAIDAVFGPLVDSKTEILAGLRNMWTTNPAIEQKIMDGEMLAFTDWSQPERSLLVKQANMLGMKLTNAGVLSNDAYQQITRFVGQYWFDKGTDAFIEFINYCLGTDLRVNSLWTEDYVQFLPEHLAGTPIWEGGTWYATTHVEIQAGGGLESLDIQTLISFFYEIANYNLVLNSIDNYHEMWMVPDINKTDKISDIVAIGLWANNSIVISNEFRYGIDSPPIQNMGGVPIEYFGTAPIDFNDGYMLGTPSAWLINDGKKFPIYSDNDRVETNDASIPTTGVGNAPIQGQFRLLANPDSWSPIPGSSRSTARLPTFSLAPTVHANPAVSTRMVGRLRQNFLCNPKGFEELEPGKFIPYW